MTIFLGDTHGKSFWNMIRYIKKWDRIVFIGDYWDSFDIYFEEQAKNFKEICLFKEDNPDRVFLLLGNHDTSYILEDMCSGYQYGAEHNIRHLFSTYKDLFQMAYSEDNILATHAGVGETWLNDFYPDRGSEYSAKIIAEEVNDLWKYKPNSFIFRGNEPTGDSIGQTPVWIRPRSLMKDSHNMKKSGIIQIVGHTRQNKIDIKGKSTGGKYFFIDTLDTSGEYLILKDNTFTTDKII